MKSSRSNFTSRIGFILSAAGSAVGLGNIWRFPYLAAQYGGGTFLLCYIILAVTFGFALMTAEIALGRKTGLSAIGAFSALNKRYRFVGVLVTLVPVIIFPYYSVIGGWVIKYFFTFLTGGVSAAAEDTYFTGFISGVSEPIVWFVIFTAITAAVVICGVEKGIEKVSKVMMPLLVVLTVGISLYVLTIDGAMEGVKYYVLPHMSDFSIKTLLSSMGQLFYSMSLAMGIMITYGSYMTKDASLERSALIIPFADTIIAIMAGLAIMPAVFASGLDPAGGPGLLFITLQTVFSAMGSFGPIFGFIFYGLVFIAAITSSIALLEAVSSTVMDKRAEKGKPIDRKLVVTIMGIIVGIEGVFVALDGLGGNGFPQIFGQGCWLDSFDLVSEGILMPLGACYMAIILPTELVDKEVSLNGNKFRTQKFFDFCIKFAAPLLMVLVLLGQIDTFFKLDIFS